MRIYTRHFFRLFLERFLVVFLFLQVFLCLCNLLAILPHAPQVPFTFLMGSAPDLLLLALPLSVSLSVIVAGFLFIVAVREQQGFFWIELSGRDPRRYQLGLLAFGLLSFLGLWFLNNLVLPKARFYVDYVLTRPTDTTMSLALRLMSQADVLPGFQTEFELVPPAGLKNFSLANEDPSRPLLVTAPAARLDLAEGGDLLEITMTDGRILRLDPQGGLSENARFDTLSISADTDRLFGADKTAVLRPRYYTSRELGRLPAILDYRAWAGLLPTKIQKKNLAAVDSVRMVRLTEAMNPALYILLFVALLGAYHESESKARLFMVAGLCLFILLPQQIYFQTLADRYKLARPVLALAPAAETAALLLVFALHRLLRRPA
jgi:hypothetical protein